jgi:hypothetical protein
MATIEAICAHKNIIHSYGRSVFTLGKHSLLYLDAGKYGIVDITENGEELSPNICYKTGSGMSDEEIDEMMKVCTNICAQSYDYSLWYYLRYRENIHLYLGRHGRDYVENSKVGKALSSRLQVW